MSYFSAREDVILNQPLYLDGIEELIYRYLGPTNEGEVFISPTIEDPSFSDRFSPSILFTQLDKETEAFRRKSIVGCNVEIVDLVGYSGSFTENDLNQVFSVEEEGDNWVKINGNKVHKSRVYYSGCNSVYKATYSLVPGDIFTTALSIAKRNNNIYLYLGGEKCKRVDHDREMLRVYPETSKEYICPKRANYRVVLPNHMIPYEFGDIVTRSGKDEIVAYEELIRGMRETDALINDINDHGISHIGINLGSAITHNNAYDNNIPIADRPPSTSLRYARNNLRNIISYAYDNFESDRIGFYRVLARKPDSFSVRNILSNRLAPLGSNYKHITSLNSMISELEMTRGVPRAFKHKKHRMLNPDISNIIEEDVDILGSSLEYSKGIRPSKALDHDPQSTQDPGADHHYRRSSVKISKLFGSTVETTRDILSVLFEGINKVKKKGKRNISSGDTVKCKKPDNVNLEKNETYTVNSIDTSTIKNKKLLWINVGGKKILSDIRNFKKIKA